MSKKPTGTNHISRKDIASRLSYAKKLHNDNQFELAKKIYKEILEASPNNPEVLYLLGLLALQEKKLQNSY